MKKILILAILSLLIAACGIDNTMYNAQNYFKAAQARALNVNGRPTPQAVDEYTKCVRKCGIILSQEKPSRRADDALFLMGRALYYKGNSAFQAKDAFEGVIKGYPNSKHIPEAHIYLAKVMREINQIPASEALLESFVRNPKYTKYHPRALLVLADYEIKDKDYHRAQYWLQKIISDYRKTPEFKEAFFLFGKNYYMQGDYARSLAEFQTFQKTRGVAKEMKLEASYYIALCQYELGDYDSAQKISRSLIRNEIRPDKLSQAKVLNARIYLAKGNIKAGLDGLEDVTKVYPRTEQAASAYYYWGEYYYFKAGDIEKATPHLNRVRTEFSNSTFADKGSKIASALTQMKKPANLDSRANLQGFLDYYYLKAQYFINPLAIVDSALVAYQRVIDEYGVLSAERDSLSESLQSITAQIDSLSALPEVVKHDLEAEKAAEESSEAEATGQEEAQNTEAEDLELLPQAEREDSPEMPEEPEDAETLSDDETIESDEPAPEAMLPEEIEAAELDTEASQSAELYPEEQEEETPAPPDPLELRRNALAEKQQLTQKLDDYQETLARFESEILPFCHFSMYSIYHEQKDKIEHAELILAIMQESFPRNIYTRAAKAIKDGKVPQLIDPEMEAAEESFDLALGYYPEAPDSLVQSMESFTESPFAELKLRANYRLGWYYSFEAPDTTLAKSYLQEVINTQDSGDYGITVRRFYDGAKYLLRGEIEPDSLRTEGLDTSTEADSSLIIWESAPADSLLPELEEPLPDTEELSGDEDGVEADSLSPSPDTDSTPAPEPLDAELEDSGDNEAQEPLPLPDAPEPPLEPESPSPE